MKRDITPVPAPREERGHYTEYKDIFPEQIIARFSSREFYQTEAVEDKFIQCRKFIDTIGYPEAAISSVDQVHSGDVIEADPACVVAADGLVTGYDNLFLTIVVADCLPVFLWTAGGEKIGLIHAGWRGTAAGIVTRAVQLMESAADQRDVLFALAAPCICQKCYEVGPEVIDHFSADHLKNSRPGHAYLDLRAANVRQLIEAGIPGTQIYSDDRCTMCHPESFFSYRRDGAGTGRMIAAFGKTTQS